MSYEWGPFDYLAQLAIGWTGLTLAVVLTAIVVWIAAEIIFSKKEPEARIAKKEDDDGIVAI